MAFALTRNVPLEAGKSALLVVDMQNYCALPGRGYHSNMDANAPETEYLFNRIRDVTVPAIQRLLKAFREHKGEIIYTYIECLTKDGRDQSLDYKISDFLVPKGHPDASIISELAPRDDEIMIPKTSCSVFMSTNINYVMRNLGVTQLVITGMVTNQCVESAVRDAADLGYLVTLPEDACVANSQIDHDHALKNCRGFSRIIQADQLVKELAEWTSQT